MDTDEETDPSDVDEVGDRLVEARAGGSECRNLAIRRKPKDLSLSSDHAQGSQASLVPDEEDDVPFEDDDSSLGSEELDFVRYLENATEESRQNLLALSGWKYPEDRDPRSDLMTFVEREKSKRTYSRSENNPFLLTDDSFQAELACSGSNSKI